MENSPPGCPACGSQHRQTKEGSDRKGQQRYQCQNCRRFYILHPTLRGKETELKHRALQMYVEGLGFRRIARLLGVPHQSVINWVRNDEKKRPPAPLPDTVETIEMDEIYTFIEKKGNATMS